jgi:radical SAM protein with 4Fe4S-binding SPASM domain
MKELMIYLKTTETCNLNCRHCFTNGINGAKIYWNEAATADWLKRLAGKKPNVPHVHLEFHGGEPFLAPISGMTKFYEECKNLWPSMSWGITTNLTFKLDEEKIKFIQDVLGSRIGTSYDPDIRFANDRQYMLWRNNVTQLLDLGVEIKLFVSLTKGVIEQDPIELLKFVKDLGIKELALERLTMNGTALQNLDIFPSNKEQDEWFLKMHEQIIEYDARHWFDNEFMESVYSKFETGFIGGGTFCRDCEEKLFTINADGSIAGCPNSAPEDHYAHINDDIDALFTNPKRLYIMACERNRDPRCYECPVFSYCGGDCHQLEWQGNICGAPKSLMVELKKTHKYKTAIPIKEI